MSSFYQLMRVVYSPSGKIPAGAWPPAHTCDHDIWVWIAAFAIISFIILRTIKRRTRWLHVAGR